MQYYKQVLQRKPVYEKTALNCQRRLETDNRDIAVELYINVMAPVLMEYVNWVLEKAINAGVQRLYFLARDGYQMYLAAKGLCQARNLQLDCRYLKVSRYALRVPEYHFIKEECLNRICLGGIDVTFEKIMKRAALTDEEGMEIARLIGYGNAYRRILNYQEVQKLKGILKEQEAFLTLVYEHSQKAYPGAMGYLRQEGLLEDVPYVLVDSGWVGTLQQTLQNLLRTEKPNITLKGYYFGLYELPWEADKNNYEAYYFTPAHGLKRKVHFSNCLFEAVFSAPEGMTVGYGLQEERYQPVLNREGNCNRRQMEVHEALLQMYLEEYAAVEQEGIAAVQKDVKGIKLTEALLSKCMGEPTELELTAYGENLFSDDVLENEMKKISADLSEEEIKKQRFLSKALIMLGLKKDTIHESAWIEGSIVKNGKHIKQNLRHAVLYKYFVYIKKMF